ASIPPEQITQAVATARQTGGPLSADLIQMLEQMSRQQASLQRWGLFWCLVGVAWWLALRRARLPPGWIGPVAGGMLVTELMVFGWSCNPESDRRLYYPPLPILERLTRAPAGRLLGVRCLPPRLGLLYGLRDVRGYDAVDPRRYVELLALAVNESFTVPRY